MGEGEQGRGMQEYLHSAPPLVGSSFLATVQGWVCGQGPQWAYVPLPGLAWRGLGFTMCPSPHIQAPVPERAGEPEKPM